MSAKPQAPARTSAKPANGNDDTALELGGGALALLALGGAAFAMARRRRRESEEEWHDDSAYHDAPAVAEAPAETVAAVETSPAEQTSPVAAKPVSAFAWGNQAARREEAQDADDDRRPGETWVERAYRGPTPNNPSVSLRNRLRRAAFFDKREREVAEGKAHPIDPGAGLPDAVTEEREFA